MPLLQHAHGAVVVVQRDHAPGPDGWRLLLPRVLHGVGTLRGGAQQRLAGEGLGFPEDLYDEFLDRHVGKTLAGLKMAVQRSPLCVEPSR